MRIFIILSLFFVSSCYEEGGGGRMLFPEPRKSRLGYHVIDNLGDDQQTCGRTAFQQRQQHVTTMQSGTVNVMFEIRNGGEVTIGSNTGEILQINNYRKKGTYSLTVVLKEETSVLTFKYKSKFGGVYWSCSDVEIITSIPLSTLESSSVDTMKMKEYFKIIHDGSDRTQKILISSSPSNSNEYCGIEIWENSFTPSLGGVLLHAGGGHYVSGAYITTTKYSNLFVRVIKGSTSGSTCTVNLSKITKKSIILHESNSEVTLGRAEPLRLGHHSNSTHSCLISTTMQSDCIGTTEKMTSHRIDLGDHILTSPVAQMSRGVRTQEVGTDSTLLENNVAHQVTLNGDSSAYRFHFVVEAGSEPSYMQLLWYTSPLTAFHHPDNTSDVSVSIYQEDGLDECPSNANISEHGYTEYGLWSGINLPYGEKKSKTLREGTYCVLLKLLNPDSDGQNIDIWVRTGPEGLHSGGMGLYPNTGLAVTKTNTALEGEAATISFHAAKSKSPISYEVFVSKDKALFRMPEQVTDDLLSVANLSSHIKPWKKKLSMDVPSWAIAPSLNGLCMFYQIVVSARNADGDHVIYAPYSYYPGGCLVPDKPLSKSSNSSASTGVIVGIVIAVVALLGLGGGFLWYRRSLPTKQTNKSPTGDYEETALQPPAFQMEGNDPAASSLSNDLISETEISPTAADSLSAAMPPVDVGNDHIESNKPNQVNTTSSSVRPQAPMLQETPCGGSNELADRLQKQRQKLDA